MPEQDPKVRVKNFDEVPSGYSPETAMPRPSAASSARSPAACRGCPVDVDIPGFIKLIAEGDFIGAARKLKETNCLPAVCGRVCPQEDQCEKVCILGKKGRAGGHRPAGAVRRRLRAERRRRSRSRSRRAHGQGVAVVGAGPAGLTIAGDLVKTGPRRDDLRGPPQGGRRADLRDPRVPSPQGASSMPRSTTSRSSGCKIVTERGHRKAEDDRRSLRRRVRRGLPRSRRRCPGLHEHPGREPLRHLFGQRVSHPLQPDEGLPLPRVRHARSPRGRTSPSSAAGTWPWIRCGPRSGSARRTRIIIYRRTKIEMPARIEEVHHAEEEGVQFQLLTNPIEYIGDEKGWVRQHGLPADGTGRAR